MSRRLSVSTEILGDEEQFRDFIGQVLESSDQIELKMNPLDLAGSRHRLPPRLLLLSNLFFGAAAQIPIRATLPSKDGVRLDIMRSGIPFSLLAVQSHRKIVDADGNKDLPDRWVELWTQPWSPLEPIGGRLFEDEPRIVDNCEVLKNENNAKRATRVVVDPHLQSASELEEKASQDLFYYWLSLVTPDSEDTQLLDKRKQWMRMVTNCVVKEPLLNLSHHAISCPPDIAPRQGIRSLVMLGRTDGGGKDSYPRLQMLVADNGYGLVDTLRPKLQASGLKVDREQADKTALEILRYAVFRPASTAKDPGLAWARERFVSANKLCESSSQNEELTNAQLTVITGDSDSNEDAIWVTVKENGDWRDGGKVKGVPFVGTTVFATLPMPNQHTHSPVERSREKKKTISFLTRDQTTLPF